MTFYALNLNSQGQTDLQATEHPSTGVFIFQDGVFRYTNPAMAEMFGYEPDQFAGRFGVSDLVHPDDQKLALQHIQQCLEGSLEKTQYIFRGVRKDRSVITCKLMGRRIDYGGGPAIIGTLQKITTREQSDLDKRKHRTLTAAIRNIAAMLTGATLDLDDILVHILNQVGKIVDYDAASIVVIEGQQPQLVISQTHLDRNVEYNVEALALSVDETGILSEMVENEEPLLVLDTWSYPDWPHSSPAEWVRSYMGIPIHIENQRLGTLHLFSSVQEAFTPQDGELLDLFTNSIAIAIQNTRLHQGTERSEQSVQETIHQQTAALQKIKERGEAILNNIPDAIVLLKPDETIEQANSVFFKLFGYEVYRQPLTAAGRFEPNNRLVTALDKVKQQQSTQRLELTVWRMDDTHFDADLVLTPLVNGSVLEGIVCSIHDISSLKEAERLKDEFVSNVSHELRTPITGLKLNHQLLITNPAKRDVYMERLGREIDRLDRLIQDLMRLSRLDQGQITLKEEAVDINQLVIESTLDRIPLAEERDLNLSYDITPDLPETWADTGLLGQVLSVLLTNAIHYTPAGGQITVKTHLNSEHDLRWLGFSVQDTGPGITSEEMPHLFERFYRGRAGQLSQAPGAGLGLALAREIVERHQGKIEVWSEGIAGKGTTFTVWIPQNT